MLNYIILAHKNPNQVRRLVIALETDNSFFYIHISASINIQPFKDSLKDITNVFFVKDEDRLFVTWGGIELLYAPLNAMKQIIADKRAGHCVLLSGQDYPIKNKNHIQKFFSKNYKTNYIDVFKLPTDLWTGGGLDRVRKYKFNLSKSRGDYVLLSSIFEKSFYKRENLKLIIRLFAKKKFGFLFKIIKKRRLPDNIIPYGGSAWWALSVDTAKTIIKYLDNHKSFLSFYKFSILPDEMFFQTIIMEIYRHTGWEEIQPQVTYANWHKPGVVLPVTFTSNDMEELVNQPSDILFARKFDISVDERVLDLIDAHIS